MSKLRLNNIKTFRYIAVIGLLVFLYALGLLGPFETIIGKALNPVLFKMQSISNSIGEKYREQTSKIDYEETFRDQQKQINELIAENAEFKIIKEENEIMRQYLDFFSSKKHNKILAGVISRGDLTDSAGRIETISIDKGLSDGLREGLAVINEQGMVIGKVSEAKESISKIYLVNNEQCRVAATILGDDKTSGIVEGELGLTMQMSFIPQSKIVNVGDVIITSGLEESIPRGLVIGRVSELVKESNDLWQTAVIESSVDLDELIIVSILVP